MVMTPGDRHENRRWQEIKPDLYCFQDSCNVYAIRGPTGTVLINTGTGRAADHLSELEIEGSLTVLLTHHFRDHTDGAIRLRAAGAEVLGNYSDRSYYLDPREHFRQRQTWNSYENAWDRFCPVRPLPITGFMMDYETRTLAGLPWEVVPTPGMTPGASSYIVTLHGSRLAFVGETLMSGGKLSRLAPLQYNLNDLPGSANLWHSCNRLLDAKPDGLYPSLGAPMEDPPGAVAALKANLKRMDEIVPGAAARFYDLNNPHAEDIREILPHLYASTYAFANTYFVISQSGKVLALDYGYHNAGVAMPQNSSPPNRRSLLHGLEGLKKRFGIDRIDTVLVTHYHDDHVAGIPLLQRLFGTQVWAGERFARVLERPDRYDLTALWPEPIKVHRRLPCGEPFLWEEIPMILYPLSGHTQFATMIGLEVDGTRVAHTGDQFYFDTGHFTPGARLVTNHLYPCGLESGCYRETVEHLRHFVPDLILTGHADPYPVTEEWFAVIKQGAQAFDDIHHRLLPSENEPNFGFASRAAVLRPYRTHLPVGGSHTLEGWVLNPFGTAQEATLQLIVPDGWESAPVSLELSPHEEKMFEIILTIPAGVHCRSQPVALDLTVGDRPFGQVAEALITVRQDGVSGPRHPG